MDIKKEDLLEAEEAREKGNEYFNEGEYEMAIFYYTRSMALNPINPMVFNNRSIAYYKFGKFDESLKDALKAYELDSRNIKSVYRITQAYKALGDIDHYKKYEQIYNDMKNNTRTSEQTSSQLKLSNLNHELMKKENQIKEIKHKETTKTSKELLDLFDKREDQENSFLLLNNQSRFKQKETKFQLLNKKKPYKDNFLIEEVYDFQRNQKKEEIIEKEEEDKDKYSLIKESYYSISIKDIQHDTMLIKEWEILFSQQEIPIAIHIQKETKYKPSYDKCEIEMLKKKADTYLIEKQFYMAMEIYEELINTKLRNTVYYFTIVSNKCSCLIKLNKLKTALCEISKLIIEILSFFDKHIEIIQTNNDYENNLNHIKIQEIDLQIYKNPLNAYVQAHKLIIQSFFWYIKYSHNYKNLFPKPTQSQVEILYTLKGRQYINIEELNNLMNIYKEPVTN